ncbi:MAG: DUF1759 domain-containing protein [Aquabacterium sp.]|nr:DUF1759 domain-containing protein [Aquabacterium sp.]
MSVTSTPGDEKQEYTRLIGKIGGHKGYLTRIKNNVENFTAQDKLEGETLVEAGLLQKAIENRLLILQALFDELLGNPNLTDVDMDTFETYVREIQNKLAKLKFKITSAQPKIEPVKPSPYVFPSDNAVVPSPCDSAVKYPEIKLPSFAGGVSGTRDFRPFYQIFKVLVEDKKDIPDIYKVQYLRECLPEGSEARNLISYIPPTEENYTLIMTTLRSRYEDTSGEANKLRRALRQLCSWPVANSVESQRKLLDHVQQNLALLEQVDEVTPDDMKGLALDMIGVLPERLKYKVCEWDRERRTVGDIMQLLEGSIKSKLEVKSFTDPTKKPPDKSNHTPSRQSYVTCHSSSQPDSSQSRSCIYCGESGHTPHSCTKKSKEERASIVAKGRRCWNCLADNHQIRSCNLPSRCSCKNKGKHSQSLCGVTPPWRAQGAKGRQGQANVVTQSEGVGLVSPGVGTVSYLSSVILELPAKSGGTQKVRFLLDGCATHTYGLDKCIDKLHVADKGNGGDMTVSSFNGPRRVSARMVELQLPGGIPISMIVTDYICEPLHGHNLDESTMEKLKEYPLGDPACVQRGSLPIDILIGVDNFWKMVTDKIVRLTPGLVVMSTHFVYVLSGKISAKGSFVAGGS